ncbi:MAG: trypsin-like peptidase domain-containing protein, partial [Calditrichia bacterium]
MDFIKKVLVIFSSILLFALVVYIIYISQQAQEMRQRGDSRVEERQPQRDRPEREFRTPGDTLWTSPDSSMDQWELPPRANLDSLTWQRLPSDSHFTVTGRFPQGNPNPIFIRAANRIVPAVVTIQSQSLVADVPQDENHRFFWERDGNDGEFFQRGSGSGIIIDKEGYILTNNHVVENSNDYNVILYDRREFRAQLIGTDPNTDIALLRIDADNLPVAYVGDSDSVQIGEWVMAVGSPLNFTS